MGNPSPQAVSVVVSRHDDTSLTNAAQSTGVEMPVLSAADSQLHAEHNNQHSSPGVATGTYPEDGARAQPDDDDDVGLIAAGSGVGRLRERMSEDLVVRCCGIVRRVFVVFYFMFHE